jgi:hypothetical protein
MSGADVTMERLEDQINWYDQRSMKDQHYFKWMKVIVIIAAALIPLLSGKPFPSSPWVVGGLGVLIAVVEGLQLLYQFQANWINYGSTCEALKHEKFLFLAKAGAYAAATDAHLLLAERIEFLVSQEHAKWAAGQEFAERMKRSGETAGETPKDMEHAQIVRPTSRIPGPSEV